MVGEDGKRGAAAGGKAAPSRAARVRFRRPVALPGKDCRATVRDERLIAIAVLIVCAARRVGDLALGQCDLQWNLFPKATLRGLFPCRGSPVPGEVRPDARLSPVSS